MATAPILAVCLLILACEPSPRPVRKPSPSVATDPHATDSLAKLMRLLLTTDEPLAVYQVAACETLSLYNRLGPNEGELRVQGVIDTIYKTYADTVAKSRAEARMRNGVTSTGSFFCDSLAAATNNHRRDSLVQKSK